jgi:hypothetical protein
MAQKIVIIESPRPEEGKEPPLPGYHELLEYLCTELRIPGSPTFWDAVSYLRERLIKMSHEDMLQQALKRPKNYFALPEEDKWAIDRRLGILDWKGPKTPEEDRIICEHHGLAYKKKGSK